MEKKQNKESNDRLELKLNYDVDWNWSPFYTGGSVEIALNGKYLLCIKGGDVNIILVSTGVVDFTLHHDEGDVTCFAVSPDSTFIVTATRALLLKQWKWIDGIACIRTWKAIHTSPIISMNFDITSTLLASGGSDGTVKVWDLLRQYCTHNFKGSPGIISTVCFHPSNLLLFSAADDYHIRVWNLQTSQCVAVLESHTSRVTCFQFPVNHILVSGGRDNIVSIWNIPDSSLFACLTPLKTIPVYESVEDIVILPRSLAFPRVNVPCIDNEDQFYFITAGSRGCLQVWGSEEGKCLFKSKCYNDRKSSGYVHARILSDTNMIVSVTADHCFDFMDIDGLSLKKHLIGNSDEVLEIKLLGKNEDYVLVVTNSCNLNVFEMGTSSCHILRGHTDIVMSADVFPNKVQFVSCSKDNSVRVWKMIQENASFVCIAKADGHTNIVSCIATSKLNASFFVSGSEDNTMKIWNIIPNGNDHIKVSVSHTLLAHKKSVNAVAISPNNKLIATGSQDRLAKLWLSHDGVHLGSFSGHQRGIWSVEFSPMDQVLATASSDGCVKLWSLFDYSCLKTLEAHDASVLKLVFIAKGTQLITAGSDGLVKLWTLKTSECVQTLDHHSGKVWALCSGRNDQILLSGSADSKIICLKDVTNQVKTEMDVKSHHLTLQHQKLQNLIVQQQFGRALFLAIALNQPYTALNAIKELLWDEGGIGNLEKHLHSLRPDQKETLFKFLVSWNSNSRNCHEAQAVLYLLLTTITPDEVEQYVESQLNIESLIPYTDRHFRRLSLTSQQATFLSYSCNLIKMNPKDF